MRGVELLRCEAGVPFLRISEVGDLSPHESSERLAEALSGDRELAVDCYTMDLPRRWYSGKLRITRTLLRQQQQGNRFGIASDHESEVWPVHYFEGLDDEHVVWVSIIERFRDRDKPHAVLVGWADPIWIPYGLCVLYDAHPETWPWGAEDWENRRVLWTLWR